MWHNRDCRSSVTQCVYFIHTIYWSAYFIICQLLRTQTCFFSICIYFSLKFCPQFTVYNMMITVSWLLKEGLIFLVVLAGVLIRSGLLWTIARAIRRFSLQTTFHLILGKTEVTPRANYVLNTVLVIFSISDVLLSSWSLTRLPHKLPSTIVNWFRN